MTSAWSRSTERRFVVAGSGAREYALARRLDEEGSRVVMVDVGSPGPRTPPHGIPATQEHRWPSAFDAAEGVIVVQDERIAKSGLVDMARQAGFPVVGPTIDQSSVERHKGGPAALLPKSEVLLDRVTVRSASRLRLLIEAHGRVVVRPARHDHHAPVQVISGRTQADDAFAAWGALAVEPYVEGAVFTAYATPGDGGTVSWSPALLSYPFMDSPSGAKTGGLRCESTDVDVPSRWPAVDAWMSEVIHGEMGGAWRTFIGVEIVDSPDGPKVVDVDAQLGCPETSVLLAVSDQSFTEILGSLAMRGWAPPIVATRRAAAAAICPPGYPLATTPAIGPADGGLLALESKTVHVDIGAYAEMGGGVYLAGPSRAGVATATGRTAAAARRTLEHALSSLPTGLTAPPARQRMPSGEPVASVEEVGAALERAVVQPAAAALGVGSGCAMAPWAAAAAADIAADIDIDCGSAVERMWPTGAPAAWWTSPLGRYVASRADTASGGAAVDAPTACAILGVSRARLYQLVARGDVAQPAAGRFSVQSLIDRFDGSRRPSTRSC